MKRNIKTKCISIALSILISSLSITPIFAHNAVYYDFLVGDSFDYELIPRDDLQSGSESGHLEWAPKVGGYFFEAGTGLNRPLFVYSEDSLTQTEAPIAQVPFRNPGNIHDIDANEDRAKYYENYTKHKDKGGLSSRGKVHTLPPTNAISNTSREYLNMSTSSAQLAPVTNRLMRMTMAFNYLLYYAAPGENPGDYSSYESDFMATAEVLADVITNCTADDENVKISDHFDNGKITIPIPVDEKNYNSVTIEPTGKTYNWEVVRYDGKAYRMEKAIRTVSTGFTRLDIGDNAVRDAKPGDFGFADEQYFATNDQSSSGNKDKGLLSGAFNTVVGWFSSGYGNFVHGISSDQQFPFRRDITLVSCIVAANTKSAVYGVTSKNAYSTRDESILGREISKFVTSVIESLTNLLNLQDYSELIFNRGVRNPESYVIKYDGTWEKLNEDGETEDDSGSVSYKVNDPYMLGIYRLSWQDMVVKFNSVFLIFGLMVICFSLVKLLMHAQTIALSPYFRHEAYKTILNYVVVALILPLTWVIFGLLAQANYYITMIFGNAINFESLTQIAVSGSGTLGGIAIGVCYFTALVYFNVVYVVRSINIAILMATSPLIISTLTLGPKYKNVFDKWLKEIIANIFLQSFHAFILTFIASAQSMSSGIESVVLVVGMIPLTSMFRSMLIGGDASIGVGERIGNQGRAVANAGLAASMMAGVRLAGAGFSGLASLDAARLQNKAKNFDGSKLKPEEATEKLRKINDKYQKRIQNKDNIKNTFESVGKVATGATMALSTDGKSLDKVYDGVETLATNTVDKTSKKLSDSISGNKESIVGVKQLLGEQGKSINATNDKISLEYSLTDKQRKKVENIMNQSAATTDLEKQKALYEIAKNAGFDVRRNSKISYNERDGSMKIEHANTTGLRMSTLSSKDGNKVSISGGGKLPFTHIESHPESVTMGEMQQRAIEANNPHYDNKVKRDSRIVQAATTVDNRSNVSTLLSKEQNGVVYTSYNSAGEKYNYSKAETGRFVSTVSDFVTNSPKEVVKGDGSIVINKSGNLENINKIDVTPHTITTYSNLDKGFEQRLITEMSKCSTDEQRIAKRNEMITQEYGHGAQYKNGQLVLTEDNHTNIVSANVDKNGHITVMTSNNKPLEIDMNKDMRREVTQTFHTASASLGYSLSQSANPNDTTSIALDSRAFGNYNNFDTDSINLNDNGELIIPLKQEVNDDLKAFYQNNKDKYGANLDNELAKYALEKYNLQNIAPPNDASGNYFINAGQASCNYNGKDYNYSHVTYDTENHNIIFSKDRETYDKNSSSYKQYCQDKNNNKNNNNNNSGYSN